MLRASKRIKERIMTHKTKAAAGVGTSAASIEQSHSSHSNSAEAQRARLLEALRRAPVSTFEARRDLDIAAPAPRIFELRNAGYSITTVWVWEASQCGRDHQIARYVLSSK
jgi:hypothetical protein